MTITYISGGCFCCKFLLFRSLVKKKNVLEFEVNEGKKKKTLEFK